MIKLLSLICLLVATSNAQSYGSSYGAPKAYAAPAPAYTAPAPAYVPVATPAPYVAPAPQYVAPAPAYTAPAPTYSAPTPAPYVAPYVAPVPAYVAPTPAPYVAPAPQYVAPTPAPYVAPVVYTTPAPYVAPAPQYVAPTPAPYVAPYVAPVPAYVAPTPAPYVAPAYVAPAAPAYTAPAAPAYTAPAYEAPVAPVISQYSGLSSMAPDMVATPEFNHMCKRVGLQGLQVFYLPHPTDQKQFIQCDDFGMAFSKVCPETTIFTENLVCEKTTDLHAVWRHRFTQSAPSTAYGSSLGMNTPIETPSNEIMVAESPEFRHLCLSNKQEQLGVSVFYVAHPSDTKLYVQCDESGRSFLKSCPLGTVFTLNLACEKMSELHAMRLQQSMSAYGSSNLESTVVAPRLEWSKESVEFRAICKSKRSSGVLVFYLPHPIRNDWFIQCDEKGRAFVKNCMAGTIFTENLACEKVGELHAIERRPEESAPLTQSTSYGSSPVVSSMMLEETPIVKSIEWSKESTEFKALCESKRVEGVSEFYLPYPTRNDWFIQCDESGRAFTKTCIVGTIFTENLACEKIGELHAIWKPKAVKSVIPFRQSSGGYNSEQLIETTTLLPIEETTTPILIEETTLAPELPIETEKPVTAIESTEYGTPTSARNIMRVKKIKSFDTMSSRR